MGLLPVVAFLAALMYFDSYKLVGLRIVVATIFVGAAAAGLSYVINDAALRRLSVDFVTYSRYVSPVIEETIKALIIVYLIRSQRIAFLVDAAIYGFAVGTGFAVVENLYYLSMRPDSLMAGVGRTWLRHGDHARRRHGDLRDRLDGAVREEPGRPHGVTARPRGGDRASFGLQPLPVPAGVVDARHPDRAAPAGMAGVPAQRALGR